MKTFIIVLLSLLCCLCVYAQDNYKQAYYITNDKDTVHGWINFSADYINSAVCNFKKEISDTEAQIFKPGEIWGYRFENEDFFYISHEIEGVKCFLQYLVNGVMNLYYLADKYDNPYFYFEENGKIVSITKKNDVISNGTLKEDFAYKKSLAPLFSAYPSIAKQINKDDFTQKSMIGITKEYHNLTCTTGESCIVYVNQYPDKKYIEGKFFVSSFYGVFISDADFIDGKHTILSGPGLGMGWNFYYPRLPQNTSTVLELSWQIMIDNDNSLNLRYQYLPNVRIGQRYFISDNKIAPFTEFGCHFPFGFYVAGGFVTKTNKNQNMFFQAGVDTYGFIFPINIYAKIIYQF
jgi:hypothetical protein